MNCCIGYITTKDKAQALIIGRALVEKKLVACANIFPGVESIYRWKDVVESGEEAVLVIKTSVQCKDKVVSLVKALHSYSCPGIVFWDISGGNPDYLNWLRSNSASTGA